MKSLSKNLKNLLKFIRFPRIDSLLRGTMIMLLVILTQVIGINSYATELQQVGITGTVTDNQGSPLPGVSVNVKGTSTGAITDETGKYSLSNVPQDATLVFSFIGMETQETALNGRIRIDIMMTEKAIGLQEVVVIGFGTVKKENLTGAVASVKGDDMVKRPVVNSAAMLQGLMAGVQVTQATGEPGNEAVNVRIRGVGTFSSAGSDPMVLIDGVLGNLANVRPSDIQSISVLKDAASASIYGARAANGVILVTTKTGTEGKMTVSYNVNYASYVPTAMLKMVYNSADYMELWNEAKINTGLTAGLYPQETIDLYRNATDRKEYPNFNWIDWGFNSAPTVNHDISISGGANGTKYNFSVGYLNEEGVLKGFEYTRYNARFTITSQVNKKIKFGANISLKNGIRLAARQGSGDAFVSIIAQAPTYSPMLPDGSGRYTYKAYAFEANNKNPAAIVAAGAQRHTIDYSFTSQAWLEVQLLKSLTWYTKVALNTDFSKYSDFKPLFNLYNFHTGDFMTLLDVGGSGLLIQDDQTVYNNLYSYLTFNHLFNNAHNVSLQVGYSQDKSIYKYLQGYRKTYVDDSYRQLDAGSPAVQTALGTENGYGLMSFFGRLSYNYKERYLFEANMRYDGSSRLSPDSRWGVFPSFSAAWRATEEKFIKDMDLTWLNNFKIRGSYGSLGNQNIGNYPYQALLSLTGNYPFNDATLSNGAAQLILSNPNIKWEKTTIADIGVDMTVFSSLTLGLDLYNKVTSDILRGSQITDLVGLLPPTVNNGTLQNRGIELNLSYAHNVENGFLSGLSYNVGATFEHYKNKLIKFGAPEISTYYIRKEGEEYNSFYLLHQIGVFKDADEVANSPKQYADITLPGDLKFEDVNSDGVIDDKDRVLMKGIYPKFNYSFNGGANWKGFDFSFMIQGVYGNKFNITDWGLSPFRQGSPPLTLWLDRWTPTNTVTNIPRIYWGDNQPTKNSRYNSWWMLDGAYMRLKNVVFGYTIPAKYTDRLKINQVRLYFSGDNLFTITKFVGLDPERTTNGSLTRYPQNKIFSFGLNVKL